MLSRILQDAGEMLSATSAEAASRAFHSAMAPLGATYLQTRVYRRPGEPLTAANHWAAGGVVTRIGRQSWTAGAEAFDYVCFECNPLLAPIREGRTRYRFSEFAPRGSTRFGRYWEAMGEAGIREALCATSYGAAGKIASLHLGFDVAGVAEEEAVSIQLAGLLLTEKLLSLREPDAEQLPSLTARERDALALVADGKTDWEISVIWSVTEATARFHVDNARRKLGAVSRAQAAARLAVRRLI